MVKVAFLVSLCLLLTKSTLAGNNCAGNLDSNDSKWNETKRKLGLMRDAMKCEGVSLKQCRYMMDTQSPFERQAAEVGAGVGMTYFHQQEAKAKSLTSNMGRELATATSAARVAKEEELMRAYEKLMDRRNPSWGGMVRRHFETRAHMEEIQNLTDPTKIKTYDADFSRYLKTRQYLVSDGRNGWIIKKELIESIVSAGKDSFDPDSTSLQKLSRQYDEIIDVEARLNSMDSGKIPEDKKNLEALARRIRTASTDGAAILNKWFNAYVAGGQASAADLLGAGKRIMVGGAKAGVGFVRATVLAPENVFAGVILDTSNKNEEDLISDTNQSPWATFDETTKMQPLITSSGFQIKTKSFLMQPDEVQLRQLYSHSNFCEKFLESYENLYPEKSFATCDSNQGMTISGSNDETVWKVKWDSDNEIKQIERTTPFDSKDSALVKYEKEEPKVTVLADPQKMGQRNQRVNFGSNAWKTTEIASDATKLSEDQSKRVGNSHRVISLNSPFIISAQRCCSGAADSSFCNSLKGKSRSEIRSSTTQKREI